MSKLFLRGIGMLLVFCATTLKAAPAAPPVKHITALQIDSTKINRRSFNQNTLQQYAKLKEFKYNEAPAAGLSWWENFWRWLWQVIRNILRKIQLGKTSWLLFRIGLFVIAVAAVAFIILKILGIDIVKLFRGQSQNVPIPYSESLENIHEISFDAEIENAINNRNYRLAVRLLYLRSLKQLNDAGLINWKIEKTNTIYLSELNETKHRQTFSLLTKQFEYIWYGDFPIDSESFQHISTLFIDFKKELP